jgi:hypothetical protein
VLYQPPPPPHHVSLTICLAAMAKLHSNALLNKTKPTWLHTSAAFFPNHAFPHLLCPCKLMSLFLALPMLSLVFRKAHGFTHLLPPCFGFPALLQCATMIIALARIILMMVTMLRLSHVCILKHTATLKMARSHETKRLC